MGQARPTDVNPMEAARNRQDGDEFYCLRFRVWYPSLDCAFRTLHRTCGGCLNCDQGRFNLKRHRTTLLRIRSFRPPG